MSLDDDILQKYSMHTILGGFVGTSQWHEIEVTDGLVVIAGVSMTYCHDTVLSWYMILSWYCTVMIHDTVMILHCHDTWYCHDTVLSWYMTLSWYCTVMIHDSVMIVFCHDLDLQAPTGLNLGCVVLLSQVVLELNNKTTCPKSGLLRMKSFSIYEGTVNKRNFYFPLMFPLSFLSSSLTSYRCFCWFMSSLLLCYVLIHSCINLQS